MNLAASPQGPRLAPELSRRPEADRRPPHPSPDADDSGARREARCRLGDNGVPGLGFAIPTRPEVGAK